MSGVLGPKKMKAAALPGGRDEVQAGESSRTITHHSLSFSDGNWERRENCSPDKTGLTGP